MFLSWLYFSYVFDTFCWIWSFWEQYHMLKDLVFSLNLHTFGLGPSSFHQSSRMCTGRSCSTSCLFLWLVVLHLLMLSRLSEGDCSFSKIPKAIRKEALCDSRFILGTPFQEVLNQAGEEFGVDHPNGVVWQSPEQKKTSLNLRLVWMAHERHAEKIRWWLD